MRKQLLAAALILGLSSSPLVAGGGMGFSDLDEDRDGYLSAEEYLEGADTDDDGQISESEYQQATGGSESGASSDQNEEETTTEW